MAGKYGPEKTPYLDTFHAVILKINSLLNEKKLKPPHRSYFLSQLNTMNLITNKITYKYKLFVNQKFQPYTI